MKPLYVLLTLACANACATMTNVTPETQRNYYAETVSRLLHLRSGEDEGTIRPSQIDYVRLRVGSVLSRDEAAETELMALGDALGAARTAGEQAEVIRLAELMVARDFTDIEAHLEKARALVDANRGPEAAFHEAIALALIHSIVDGADGSSERPFPIVGPRESDAVMGRLGLCSERQPKGRRFAVQATRCRDGRGAVTMHFECALTRPK